jgi:hypothetical protein
MFFTNLELLKIVCECTPRFSRSEEVGLLREGYEASFLGLEGNPLMKFQEIKNLALRFK